MLLNNYYRYKRGFVLGMQNSRSHTNNTVRSAHFMHTTYTTQPRGHAHAHAHAHMQT